MAFASHAKDITSYATKNSLIAFKLTAKKGINCIPQPTSSDEVVMKN